MNKNKSFINKIYRKKSIDKIKRKVDLFGVSKNNLIYVPVSLYLVRSPANKHKEKQIAI